ncbi:hypothetical protein KTR66_09640 [Roseococcus sp. SDR]|uniref:hypothetical protein n=1 Tax=Roseococcus sp. SDR TaxID=2835532 RepID=UPI001BCD86E6|nr:hypothetical protein [Roseococcus sp. SDR]MBS7790258.1 hypothetical protein [Roseococcus sp. SDR]MBV1845572.1 hypothetical protein [Roseococcus sp. SDR]
MSDRDLDLTWRAFVASLTASVYLFCIAIVLNSVMLALSVALPFFIALAAAADIKAERQRAQAELLRAIMREFFAAAMPNAGRGAS